MQTKVVVVGAAGRMGTFSTEILSQDPAFDVVGLVDRRVPREVVSSLPIETDLEACLKRTKPDVTLVFTTGRPAGSFAHVSVSCGIATVIGSSGVDNHEIDMIKKEGGSTPCLLVPNLSVAGVLLMQFVRLAAKQMPNSEIIEYHDEKAVNSPSGTSLYTARAIAAARIHDKTPISDQTVRGIPIDGVTIHSVRLQGLDAHQEVLFGGPGELLTIRHDTHNISSFEKGIKLCCSRVRELNGFVVGMENLF